MLDKENKTELGQPRSGLLKHLRSRKLGLPDGDYKTELGQLRGGILYLPDDGENKTDVGQLRAQSYACLTERTRQSYRRAQETANHVLLSIHILAQACPTNA